LIAMTGVTLVTGGAGFIGSHIVDRLVAAGRPVRVLDALLPAAHAGVPDYLNPGADWIRGDVRDPGTLAQALEGVESVCHQAAMVGLGVDFGDAPAYASHNDVGTAELLRGLAARRWTGRLVLAGSMVVYGEGSYACAEHGDVQPGPRAPADLRAGHFEPPCPVCRRALQARAVTEDAAADPRNVYAATKLHQEHLCAVFAHETGASLTVLRYHNVYGPRMPRDTPYAGVASIFRSALAAGRAPRVFEDGRQLRDFVQVDDVARANELALTAADPRPGVFNIASGTPRSVGNLARALATATGGTQEPEVTGEFRLGDVRHVFASTERARDQLGFSAEVGWKEGIAEFVRAPLRAPPL